MYHTDTVSYHVIKLCHFIYHIIKFFDIGLVIVRIKYTMTSAYPVDQCHACTNVSQDTNVPSDVVSEMEGGTFSNSIDMYNLKQDELDIYYTKKLGVGTFCSVFPVHIRNGETMEFNKQLPPFALKQLNSEIVDNPKIFKHAYADLFHEAQMLKKLKHENILSLVGMGDTSIVDKKKEFFIITEMLESTLESRMETWEGMRNFWQRYIPNDVIEMRLRNVAIPIASALGYLHSKRIVYRDLKPANIGFDLAGNVKVFDFGLALQIPEGKKVRGLAGTLRYMAPEMKTEFHSFPVDVYSFSILLWEIITSHVAFQELQGTVFSIDKIPGDKRPNLNYVASSNHHLRYLLENSWTIDPTKRWDFPKVILELQQIVSHLSIEKSEAKKKSSFLTSTLLYQKGSMNYPFTWIVSFLFLYIIFYY